MILDELFNEVVQMKKLFLFVPVGVLFTVLGCSGNSQNTVSKASTLPVVQASPAPANPSPAAEPVAALPAVSLASNHQRWHSEILKDTFGKAVALKQTSSDGKFDLVIVLEGTHSFLSFAKHAQWESVHHRAAQGKLMNLRLKFEDGEERSIVWDELGFGTTKVYSVVWSYPTKPDSPVGPVLGSKSDSVGGDELLVQDMMKHTAMVLEVAPGVTTQFDITGLAREIQKANASGTESVLAATQAEAE
jgi:hypothetical protein